MIGKGCEHHHPPDPLAIAEIAATPLQQCYPLATGGHDRGIDALSIVCQVLEPLTEDERSALLAYVNSRFQGGGP